MKLTINPKFQSLLWPLTPEEKHQLEENLKKDGCRDPLVIWQGILIDGHNRYEICQRNNIPFKTISLDFDNEAQVIDWIDKNQVGRRNITADQLRVIRGRSYNRMKQDKTNNLTNVSKAQIGPSTNTAENLANVSIGQIGHSTNTAEKLAKEYGVSEHTIRRDAKFALEVDSTPELKKAVANKIPVKQIINEKKSEQRKNQVEAIRKEITKENLTVTDKFDVLTIDPPWNYSEANGGDDTSYDAVGNRGIVPYPTMTLEKIQQIQLPLKDNAVVFLWTTQAFLPYSYDLLTNWGLDYKATIVWDKEKMGMGRTIRLQCEFCLLATKGKPIIQGSSTRDIIREARREHSRKPEAFYKMVEDITIGSKCDYFSREKRKGWTSIGVEKNKF